MNSFLFWWQRRTAGSERENVNLVGNDPAGEVDGMLVRCHVRYEVGHGTGMSNDRATVNTGLLHRTGQYVG